MRLNLTQHVATPEQGCQEPKDKAAVQRLLTVETLPTESEIQSRCAALASLAAAEGAYEAMIGGAPWMMAELERALLSFKIQPLYAFSIRESVDQKQADGGVRKVAVFRHIGFVNAVKASGI